jgi:hypothetical protein
MKIKTTIVTLNKTERKALRAKRLAKGMTLIEATKGICTPAHLHHIETQENCPVSESIILAIMKRIK